MPAQKTPAPTSPEIRQQFLDFFREKGHEIVPSAPLVPQDDPTLLFINAGMNPFKDVFLGTGSRPYSRAADTQKCLRVSGKHNDLEEVGLDTYHHTLFEMLGNWSFGDYFKEEAISWAWELLVDRWGLSPDRLYVSVHEGDDQLGLAPDTEAAEIWKTKTTVPHEHILFQPSKDNFWMMGETGPCGPCSEIHVDIRPDAERKRVDGRALVNADHPQVIEVWNLVFIQYNAQPDGSLQPLAAKHVDTGMGFERICAVLQGKGSNYDSDVFTPLLSAAAGLAPEVESYGKASEKEQVALRVIADHARAVTFAVADGAQPGPGGRGYVIRRLLRRAVRYGYQALGLREPFLYKLVGVIAEQMGETFPEVPAQQDYIERIVKGEEESFLRTLGDGLSILDTVVEMAKKLMASADAVVDTDTVLADSAKQEEAHKRVQELVQSDSTLKRLLEMVDRGKGTPPERDFMTSVSVGIVPGSIVFLLHDTYGFPSDLTGLIIREAGLTPGWEEYDMLMGEQKARARAAGSFSVDNSQVDTWDATAKAQTHDGRPIQFVGYDQMTAEGAHVLKTRTVRGQGSTDDATAESRFELVLDKTPFYGESGGQVGDTGLLTVGGEELVVLDTQKDAEGTIVHVVERLPSDAEAEAVAVVDESRRRRIMRHHSATHLLHAALRGVLGPHVQQKGSLVAPDRLRFDFAHYARVEPEELREVERQVNAAVLRNIPKGEERAVPIDEAKARGAMALFGEKYGEVVRMITFDPEDGGFPPSVELCGGTHVEATGEIGPFRITSESSVAAGIRRIEAVAGEAALALLDEEREALEKVRGLFKTLNRPVEDAVSELQDELKAREKEVAQLQADAARAGIGSLLDSAEEVEGVRLVTGTVPGADGGQLRDLAQELRETLGENGVVVLGAADEEAGKATLACAVTDDLVKRGVQAGTLVGVLARKVKGGGGGRPQLATAGGKDPAGLPDALAAAADQLREMLA